MTKHSPQKILILNVHSALNLGDDGIMQATLKTLGAAFEDAQIVISANDPSSWRKLHGVEVHGSLATWVADPALGRWRERMPLMLLMPGVLICAALAFRFFGIRPAWGSTEKRRLLESYYDANLVLSCGGGNFYAHRPLSPALIWALFSLAFAVIMGKPIVMLPQSIGPIVGTLQRRLAQWTLSRVKLILTREERSKSFIQEVLKVKTPVVIIPDLAFALASSTVELPPAQPAEPPKIGVTVIDRSAQMQGFRGQERYEDALTTLLVNMARHHNGQIHVFCQCFGPSPDQDDRAIARRLYERLRQNDVMAALHTDFKDASEIIAAYKELNLVIGTRMHTGIFALSNCVPVLLIGYQPKACGMMSLMGLERYCYDITDINATTLYELANEMLLQQNELRTSIAQRLSEIKVQVNDWVKLMEEILCRASA